MRSFEKEDPNLLALWVLSVDFLELLKADLGAFFEKEKNRRPPFLLRGKKLLSCSLTI